MDKKWSEVLNFVEMGRKPDMSAQALGMAVLLRDVFRKQVELNLNVAVHDCNESGNIENVETAFQVRDYLKQKGGRLIYQVHHEKFGSYIFLWDNSIVELEYSGEHYMSVVSQSLEENFISELRAYVKPLFVTEIAQGHIFAIVSQGGHLSLNNIGNAGIPLERRNYNSKVMEDYDYVVKDLNSNSPSGRISIIEGEPGTGKTHLVRAMLMSVPDAMFVLVSPDMVSQLDGPQLLPLLLSHRNNQDGPIILVLEDADKCLVIRQGDNMSSIQSLLNLGDGILGSLLDLRIVATTNAKKLEMEPALLRPGRLSRRLEVGPLELDIAKGVFSTLCPEVELPKALVSPKKDKLTLAEVYIMARKAGWEPPARQHNARNEGGDPRAASCDDIGDEN